MIKPSLLPFVDDVSQEDSSYLYIQSQGCGHLEPLTAPPLIAALKQQYPLALSAGFTIEQLSAALPADRQSALVDLIAPHPFVEGSFQFRLPPSVLEMIIPTRLPNGPPVETLKQLASAQQCGDELCVQQLEQRAPGFTSLMTKWNSSPLKSLVLNSVGIAIAHANARRVCGLSAPLEIWIK
ncbi:hypothetical protein MTR72_16410 [Bradyrhizobium sp. ISRA442]|uniref:LPO_1073/Vpar_1526 family protein n=1 Tax=Bradyrhizobium sp. ISRA442 TaxID=2866197 RepID=UPI00311AFE47